MFFMEFSNIKIVFSSILISNIYICSVVAYHDVGYSFQKAFDDRLVRNFTEKPGAVALPNHALQSRHVAVVAPYSNVMTLDHQT